MKLDRNITNPRRGKYALIKLRAVDRAIPKVWKDEIEEMLRRLNAYDVLDYGEIPSTDFFVIRLKDKYAGPALHAYAEAAKTDDPEYAADVDALAQAADRIIPKRMPD